MEGSTFLRDAALKTKRTNFGTFPKLPRPPLPPPTLDHLGALFRLTLFILFCLITQHIFWVQCTFLSAVCRNTLSTILCIKDQYIMIQYSALQNCIVQYSVVQYNTIQNCHVMFITVPQCS